MLKKRLTSDNFMFHMMLLIPLILILLFNYIPMVGGIIVAFKNFKPGLGFTDSPWVGIENFTRMFQTDESIRALYNTLIIAFWKIIFNLIIPIIFALLLNEVRLKWFKKLAQTITYLPFFISWVILAGIFTELLSVEGGMVNQFLGLFGVEPIFFLGDNSWFRKTLIVTEVWKNFGYNTIIYMAALTGININLYEAASMDGANRWKQTIHITLPGIATIIALMSILSIGSILNAGFDQVYNLYNVAVYKSGDIIDTLVYRLGLQQFQYSFSTAVGMFKSIVSLILIGFSNHLAEKYAGYRVF